MRGRIKTRTRSPGSPQLASQSCVLLLEGREEGGTWPRKQPPLEDEAFPEGGEGRQDGREPPSLQGALQPAWFLARDCLCSARDCLCPEGPCEECCLFRLRFPRQGQSKSGAWASECGLQPAGLDRKGVGRGCPSWCQGRACFLSLKRSPSL